MAIDRLGIRTNPMGYGIFQRLSTDDWPLPATHEGVVNGSRCYVLDTGKTFVFSVSNINVITDNGWWEV